MFTLYFYGMYVRNFTTQNKIQFALYDSAESFLSRSQSANYGTCTLSTTILEQCCQIKKLSIQNLYLAINNNFLKCLQVSNSSHLRNTKPNSIPQGRWNYPPMNNAVVIEKDSITAMLYVPCSNTYLCDCIMQSNCILGPYIRSYRSSHNRFGITLAKVRFSAQVKV